jgi:ribonuclease P protein component
MLPQGQRLTRPEEFKRTIRGGCSVRRPTVIVYGAKAPAGAGGRLARAGVTVSKSVGGSVVRHRVARVIRHQLQASLAAAPGGSTWVVRALPRAGHRDASRDIATDVAEAFREVLDKVHHG